MTDRETTTHNSDSTPAPSEGVRRPVFVTTHWTVVLTAGRSNTARAQEALAKLCQTYWQPLYAYVRRRGYSPHDSQDLTQEFFARLLEQNWLARADREKGRFRSFLLIALKHFLANEWDKVNAKKRGGGQIPISIDASSAETTYRCEPADNLTADKIFERRWALTLLNQVLVRLRNEFAEEGKVDLFERLKGTLTGERSLIPYADIGAKLTMSETAVKVAAHRLRKRYRELLRDEIAQTVADPAEIDDEIRALFAAFSG